MRRVLIATIAVAALAVPGLASAAPVTVKAVTHAQNHPDTTSVPTGYTSDNGPVWALDNLSIQLAATPESGPGNYSVTITVHGSFAALANPITGAPYSGNGSVDGTITFDVLASTGPDPGNVPAQQPQATIGAGGVVSGSTSLGGMINQLFDGNAVVVGGGSYSFSYNRIPGPNSSGLGWTLVNGRYTQFG